MMLMMKIFNRKSFLEQRRKLRKEATSAEKILWESIRSGQLGIRFRRQVGIGNYIVDFYAPRKRIVLEVDGSIHDVAENKLNDDERQKNLEALGLIVLRFSNHEIFYRLDYVIDSIRAVIQNPLLTKERAG